MVQIFLEFVVTKGRSNASSKLTSLDRQLQNKIMTIFIPRPAGQYTCLPAAIDTYPIIQSHDHLKKISTIVLLQPHENLLLALYKLSHSFLHLYKILPISRGVWAAKACNQIIHCIVKPNKNSK